jgi:MobC-like protein
MPEETKNRTKIITLRLAPAEYEQLKKKFKTTTCRKLSEYIRKVLLTGKVTVLTRNQSLDDFMAEMIALRNELSALGNNYNQAVHKLHILNNLPELREWVLKHYVSHEIFINKVEEIKKRINQFAEKW